MVCKIINAISGTCVVDKFGVFCRQVLSIEKINSTRCRLVAPNRTLTSIKDKEIPLGLVGGVYWDALILARVESVSQVEIPTSLQVQYSNSNKTNLNYSNSTVRPSEIINNISDLIPNPDYTPWYVKQLRRLGSAHFMELANKARASSDAPAVLFKWYLKNDTIVK